MISAKKEKLLNITKTSRLESAFNIFEKTENLLNEM